MRSFVRLTLFIAAIMVGLAALAIVLKLLVAAAVIAGVLGLVAGLVRALGYRCASGSRRVTTLTARR